jgi:lipid A 3-O-deacylase
LKYEPKPSSVLSKIFPKVKEGENYYGYTIATNMYTPSSIKEVTTVGDRPYAGWAYLGLTNISNNPTTGIRFTSELSLGAIGPITQQESIQKSWHTFLGRPLPQGWSNQIANDIALNFNFVGEKRFGHAENMALVGIVETNLGTVSNYFGIGGMVKLGFFDDYFNKIIPISNQQKWQAFVFVRPVARIVADNALLQGGILTYNKSPYTIPKDNLKRLYAEAEFGYGLSHKKFNITYSQNLRTAEFDGAKNMFWGAMKFAYSL